MFFFRKPRIEDAQMLLDWRTSPAVTEQMFTDVPYDLKRQRAWLQASAARDDFQHFIIERSGEDIGYLSFPDIDWKNRHCSCGSYLGSAELGRKYGGLMHTYFMDYIFHVLHMNKLINYFLASNRKIIRIQEHLRLRKVGTLTQHVLKNEIYHDVEVFELLKADWVTHPHTAPLEVTLKAFEKY